MAALRVPLTAGCLNPNLLLPRSEEVTGAKQDHTESGVVN